MFTFDLLAIAALCGLLRWHRIAVAALLRRWCGWLRHIATTVALLWWRCRRLRHIATTVLSVAARLHAATTAAATGQQQQWKEIAQCDAATTTITAVATIGVDLRY